MARSLPTGSIFFADGTRAGGRRVPARRLADAPAVRLIDEHRRRFDTALRLFSVGNATTLPRSPGTLSVGSRSSRPRMFSSVPESAVFTNTSSAPAARATSANWQLSCSVSTPGVGRAYSESGSSGSAGARSPVVSAGASGASAGSAGSAGASGAAGSVGPQSHPHPSSLATRPAAFSSQ